ncbi:hypothetical protein B0H14DRAFT_2571008 [Mycena olivaceomarginata]|nr:hypothetical protein B0H14DRAFT_2571008 [Mycena olivaceomarginata]
MPVVEPRGCGSRGFRKALREGRKGMLVVLIISVRNASIHPGAWPGRPRVIQCSEHAAQGKTEEDPKFRNAMPSLDLGFRAKCGAPSQEPRARRRRYTRKTQAPFQYRPRESILGMRRLHEQKDASVKKSKSSLVIALDDKEVADALIYRPLAPRGDIVPLFPIKPRSHPMLPLSRIWLLTRCEKFMQIIKAKIPSAFPRTADPFNTNLPPGFLEDWAELQAIQAAARDDTPDV